MRAEPDQRARAAATTRSGSQRSRASAERFQRIELRPGNLRSCRYRSQKTRRNEYPPHEAHQRTAALIGVVSQRSCAATVFIRNAAVQARK